MSISSKNIDFNFTELKNCIFFDDNDIDLLKKIPNIYFTVNLINSHIRYPIDLSVNILGQYLYLKKDGDDGHKYLEVKRTEDDYYYIIVLRRGKIVRKYIADQIEELILILDNEINKRSK